LSLAAVVVFELRAARSNKKNQDFLLRVLTKQHYGVSMTVEGQINNLCEHFV